MSKTIKLDIPTDAKERNYRRIASEAAKDSIVTDALARLIEQIVREIHESTIEPLRAELATAANARVHPAELHAAQMDTLRSEAQRDLAAAEAKVATTIDDAMAVARERDDARADLAALRADLATAREALEFYAWEDQQTVCEEDRGACARAALARIDALKGDEDE